MGHTESCTPAGKLHATCRRWHTLTNKNSENHTETFFLFWLDINKHTNSPALLGFEDMKNLVFAV